MAAALFVGGCSGSGTEQLQRSKARPTGASERGSATKPLPPPTSFYESPHLAELVQAGKLPPVVDRLPARPYVLPHRWLERGKYGGELRFIIEATSGGGANRNSQHMYGHSLLRYLNDALDIGPGLVESWEANDNASEWTLHFRTGLKWSDGAPWSTADIMFWWEDTILNPDHSDEPPEEARSGTGKVMEMSAPDATTLVLRYDGPAPLTADRLAMWVKGGGGQGPAWMLPKHYLKQFHPRYNPNAPKDWAAAGGEFVTNAQFTTNTDCPTMTGWRLTRHTEGEILVWERNPYYWCVTPDGDQLPYIDRVVMSAASDREVRILRVQEGNVDYVQGGGSNGYLLTLSDVSGLERTKKRHDMDVFMYDSGSGTGSMFFFNYDYGKPALQSLIRNPRFRQALSFAVDRDRIRKDVYFNTGENTTGTLSPKAIEYVVNDEGGRIYRQWRDSYVRFDPERAMSMLDELGVVDRNGDGVRELPDGSSLVIRIDDPAGASDEHTRKTNLLVRDWRRIGLAVQQNPVSPTAFPVDWAAGRLMSTSSQQVGDGPNHLAFPHWLVPIAASHWAPLQGQFYSLRGTPKENAEKNKPPLEREPPRQAPEPGGPIEKLWELYDRSKLEPDALARHRLVWDMIKIHIEHGPFFLGTVANAPWVVAAKNRLRNVPRRENLARGGFVAPTIHPTPAVYDPEAFFWDDGSSSKPG